MDDLTPDNGVTDGTLQGADGLAGHAVTGGTVLPVLVACCNARVHTLGATAASTIFITSATIAFFRLCLFLD
jgi:hypothetical protein